MNLLPIIPNTVRWFEWRKGGIGGSDIGPLYLGDEWPYKRKNVITLAQEKAGVIPEVYETNFAMEKGRRLEPIAIHKYEQATHIMTQRRCVQHSTVDWMRVTLDGLGRCNRDWRLVEVKFMGLKNHLLARNCGIVPPHYLPQLNWQMSVCEAEECDFVSYCDSETLAEVERLAIIRVKRDPSLQQKLFETGEEFWKLVEHYRRKGSPVPSEVLNG